MLCKVIALLLAAACRRLRRIAARAALLSAITLTGWLWAGSAWAGCGNTTINDAQTLSGGTLSVCQNLYVGDSGTGSLAVSDGGVVSDDYGTVGQRNGVTGTVTITGAGSRWTNSGQLTVGNLGTGSLSISNGGAVSNTRSYVGASITAATGTVTVTGSGSTWTNSGDVHIGLAGRGTLTISDGGTVTVGGGTGTLRLAHQSDDTGTFNIGAAAGEAATAAGRLNAGTVAFGSGTGRGTVVFNHTDTNYTFSQRVYGPGSVKAYSGTTKFTGTNSYSGTTTVHGGTLLVDGSITSTATVASSGTLGGTGTLGAVNVQSGGIFAPGNSIGTTTVNGNFALDAGGILKVEVDNTGNADKVIVTGAVDVSGATLRIVGLTGTYNDDQYVHAIISNDGADAVVGVFNTIDNKLAFYSATVSYTGDDGNDVVLTLDRNANNFSDMAETPNQQAVATHLSALSGSDGDTIRNSILGLTTEGTRNAYAQLAGDIYATNQQVNVQVTQQVRQQVASRLANLRAVGAGTARRGVALSARQIAGFAPSGPVSSDGAATALGFSKIRTGIESTGQSGLWAQAVGGFGEVDGDENAAAVDYAWRGVMSGYDVAMSPDLRMGVFFGYVDGENNQSAVSTHLDNDTLMAGVYGEYRLEDWRLSAQAGWSRVDADSRRNLTFGSVDRTALAEYTDHVISVEAELAKGFAADGLWLEPYGAVVVQRQYLAGFNETGAGSANLIREHEKVLSGNSTVGLRASGLWDSGKGWQLVPQAGLGWKHHFGPTDNGVMLCFSGGEPFSVNGTKTDHDTLIGNLGISRISDEGWRAYADYRPSISTNQREHSFVAGVRVEW